MQLSTGSIITFGKTVGNTVKKTVEYEVTEIFPGGRFSYRPLKSQHQIGTPVTITLADARKRELRLLG